MKKLSLFILGAVIGIAVNFILHSIALRIGWLFNVYFSAAHIICSIFISFTKCGEIGCVGCAIVYQIFMLVVFAVVGGVVGWAVEGKRFKYH